MISCHGRRLIEVIEVPVHEVLVIRGSTVAT